MHLRLGALADVGKYWQVDDKLPPKLLCDTLPDNIPCCVLKGQHCWYSQCGRGCSTLRRAMATNGFGHNIFSLCTVYRKRVWQ